MLAPRTASTAARPVRTYDVTNELQPGENTVGIWLGNGYGPRFSPYASGGTGAKQAILLIEVTFTDGTRQTITTDDGWKWSNGPITANDIYAGEAYDARLEQPAGTRPVSTPPPGSR